MFEVLLHFVFLDAPRELGRLGAPADEPLEAVYMYLQVWDAVYFCASFLVIVELYWG